MVLRYLQNFEIFSAIILSLDVFVNARIFFYTTSIYSSMFASLSFNFFMFLLYSALVLGGLLNNEFDYEKSDINI